MWVTFCKLVCAAGAAPACNAKLERLSPGCGGLNEHLPRQLRIRVPSVHDALVLELCEFEYDLFGASWQSQFVLWTFARMPSTRQSTMTEVFDVQPDII